MERYAGKTIRSLPAENGKGLKIRATTILIGIMCFIMILPDDVFGLIPLYSSVTPSNIAYIWLNYHFGIVQLLILLVGIYYAIRLNKKGVVVLGVIMLVRELFYLLIGDNNIFSASAYEMYLTIFVGYAFVLWAEGALKSHEKCERYFKWFLVTNMLTLYINFVMGGTGGILEGRYHSSNLDVGGTGIVCVLTILYLAYSDEKKWHDFLFIGLSIIGLFLSGSRANLLFVIIIIGVNVIVNLFTRYKGETEKKKDRNSILRKLLIAVLLLIGFVVAYEVYYEKIMNWLVSSRFQALFSSQGLRSDDSFLGRAASFEAGFDVLKNHPLGISGYFINLQSEIRMRGYPTFPHSTLLSMYLILGPIILFIYFKWFRNMRRLWQINRMYSLILLYLLISTTIYGGPTTNFKMVFIALMVTKLTNGCLAVYSG